MDEEKISRLQADLSGLSDTLEERDEFIRKLSSEITELQSKNLDLEVQLAAAGSEKAPAEAMKTASAVSASFSFTESRREIEELLESLEQGLSSAQVSTMVIAELEETRLKRDLAVRELTEQSAALAQAKIQAVEALIENADLKERVRKETQAASQALVALEVIQQRVDLSFTASQLAGYMSQAIDSFNHEAQTGNLSVNYIINDMEVTFKASLTKNATGEMTLAAPSLSSGDESLSTIKFTIAAIPKEEDNNLNIGGDT